MGNITFSFPLTVSGANSLTNLSIMILLQNSILFIQGQTSTSHLYQSAQSDSLDVLCSDVCKNENHLINIGAAVDSFGIRGFKSFWLVAFQLTCSDCTTYKTKDMAENVWKQWQKFKSWMNFQQAFQLLKKKKKEMKPNYYLSSVLLQGKGTGSGQYLAHLEMTGSSTYKDLGWECVLNYCHVITCRLGKTKN